VTGLALQLFGWLAVGFGVLMLVLAGFLVLALAVAEAAPAFGRWSR